MLCNSLFPGDLDEKLNYIDQKPDVFTVGREERLFISELSGIFVVGDMKLAEYSLEQR